MHETPDDIAQLQAILDASDGAATPYHHSIFTNRIHAQELPDLLRGVQIINLATVTSRCEPRVAPVDGIFYRGRFHFGSSEGALRFQHIRRRPAVSAAHTRGEELAILVHGAATLIDTSKPEHAGLRDYLIEIYGRPWHQWGAGAPYARIEPTKMFAARMRGSTEGEHDRPSKV